MTGPLYVDGATGYDSMFARVTAAYIPALMDVAVIAAGHRVLDVATGTGAAARAAAELVGPTGEIVAGDISSTMLKVARRNPENSAIKFQLLDGHALPFPDSRFDRVICQLGLAFFEDPARGLAEFRRVLAPGGRTAITVNSTPERSLFTRICTVIGKHVPAKAEQLNRYASIRTAERLSALLHGAGFTEVMVRSELRSFSFASFDDYFSGTDAGAGISGQEYVKLSADLRHAVREEVRQSFPDAGKREPLIVEMEVLVGSGTT
ncbi:class I SAM-dependent methyltransferase [Phyllobacterium brassicacearum]|nr:methyltransferase domain-containing protein [Phyllobacterium brassicacearum]TDQ12970.1 ubiquinone/menaquinone biosynthesis C-methylase UbiE [Phyllobacterium brassicacearum]